MSQENTFVEGLRVSKPKEGTPEFVKLRFGAKVDDLVKFLQENVNDKGWLNFDLLKSKNGNLYLALNTYKKKEESGDPVEGLSEEPPQPEEIIKPEEMF